MWIEQESGGSFCLHMFIHSPQETFLISIILG